ncbi:MAG: hypothetical protein AMJ72_05845 [Acidithiobacillales bacterium SM1_46]|nr:MAG: hypothetical protein AMJ72_05845 [Acidithiobacillales bacterium SM1_46]
MGILSKEQILQADDLRREQVVVPDWDGSVFVQTMTGIDRDAFELSLTKDGKASIENMRAKLCARTIVDENGNRLFTEDDVEALGKKSGTALDRIFEVAQRLNGIGADAMEKLAKNSEPTPGDDFCTS